MKKAYLIDTGGEDEGQDIVFAESEQEAKERSLELTDYEEVSTPIHQPQYDGYRFLGYVPPKVLIEDGWFWSCSNCESRVDSDNEQENRDPDAEEEFIYPDPVFLGKEVFCCQNCFEQYHQAKLRRDALRVEALQTVLKKFPDADITSLWANREYVGMIFRLSGLEREVTWRSNDPDHVTVAQGDAANFEAYKKRRWHKKGEFTAIPFSAYQPDFPGDVDR